MPAINPVEDVISSSWCACVRTVEGVASGITSARAYGCLPVGVNFGEHPGLNKVSLRSPSVEGRFLENREAKGGPSNIKKYQNPYKNTGLVEKYHVKE